MYEKIAILAALSARVDNGDPKAALGSATIGERIAKLARACEAYDAGDGEYMKELLFAEVKRIAEACRLEAYVDINGSLYVGRPHYFVKMNGHAKRSDAAGKGVGRRC